MTDVGRPAVLVSSSMLGSARAVWDHRAAFGTLEPDVFVLVDGRPLSTVEAAPLVPWAGNQTFAGTFLDALAARRVSMVLPLLDPNPGTLQGMLEFLDVPYAGCGMTGVLLAHDSDHCRAVLESEGLPFSADASVPSTSVAVLGNDQPTGPNTDPAAAFAWRVYRALGLGGWSLIEVALVDEIWHWKSISVLPDLAAGSPFRRALDTQGLSLSEVLVRVMAWGQARHDTETRLRLHFKDRI